MERHAVMQDTANHCWSTHRSNFQRFIPSIVSFFNVRQVPAASVRLLAVVMTLGSMCLSANAQGSEWVWMGGSGNLNAPGVYGTIGVPSTQNIPGGRYGSAGWIDNTGNLWLFGGNGADSEGQVAALNDLWRFTPSSNPQNSQWTWMGGSSTVICEVGILPCYGHRGVYGTLGAPAADNLPGSRQGAASWTDANGIFWLFGGAGYDAAGTPGYLNDLWRFDPAANQWTWMGGNNKQQLIPSTGAIGQPGVYGNLGTPAAGNVPGGRSFPSTWMDDSGSLWLFGGLGNDGAGQAGELNDLWKFDPSSGLWTWIAGSDRISFCGGPIGQCGQSGVYGQLGTPAAGNTPGGRSQAANWIDRSGNLWLFGGFGYDVNGNTGSGLNDLWKFDPNTGLWAWMSGSSELPCGPDPLNGFKTCMVQPGAYGTLGIPAPGNVPPGGEPAAAWTDQQGNLWLFGGASFDLTGQARGTVNDLWAFNPSSRQWAWMGGDTAASNCSVILVDVVKVAYCDGSQSVFGSRYTADSKNFPGSRMNAQAWVDKNGSFWLFGGGAGVVFDVNGPTNDLWKYQPSIDTLPAATPPIFSLKAGTYFSGGPLSISNGMANSSIFYTTDGTTPTTASTPYSGPLVLSSSEILQAFATAPGYLSSSGASAAYSLLPVLATPIFSVAPGTYASTQTVSISDSSPNVTIFYTTDGGVPTNGSIKYIGPISVTSSETINAIAEESGYVVNAGGLAVKGFWDSAVATGSYTISPLPPDFTIGGTNVTVARGATTGNTSTIALTPAGGLTGTVTLSAAVTSSPTGAVDLPTLSFGATSPVNITSANPGNAILTITTTAATSAVLDRPALKQGGGMATGGAVLAFLVLFCGIPAERRKWKGFLGMAFLLMVLARGVIACGGGGGGSGGGGGGGGGNLGTTPGNYTITVTGTTGTLTHTCTFTLTVN